MNSSLPLRKRFTGVLRFSEHGSRLDVQTATGVLQSADLGKVTLADAIKKAWLHRVPLLVNGRIYGRSHV